MADADEAVKPAVFARIGVVAGMLGLLFVVAVPYWVRYWVPEPTPPPAPVPVRKFHWSLSGGWSAPAERKQGRAAAKPGDGSGAGPGRLAWWLGASRVLGALLGLSGMLASGAGWAARERPGMVAGGIILGMAAVACAHAVTAVLVGVALIMVVQYNMNRSTAPGKVNGKAAE